MRAEREQAAPPRPAGGEASALSPEVWRLLGRSAAPGDEEPSAVAEALAGELAHLGPAVAPALIDVLTGADGGPPPKVASPEEEPVRRGEPPPAPLRREALVLSALGRLPRQDVVEVVRPLCTGTVPRAHRLLGFRILGEIGGAESVEVILEGAAQLEEIELLRPYVQKQVVLALQRVLDRDDFAELRLRELLGGVPRPVLPLVARALGAAASPGGVDLLLRLLGRDVALDLVVVEQIADLASKGEAWIEEGAQARLRELLDRPEPELRRNAAVSLARLVDVESFPRLVDLLEDGDPRVRDAALWALQSMGRVRLPAEPERWRVFWQGEIRWWGGEGSRLRRQLDSRHPATAVRAVARLSQHPLFRQEAAEAITAALRSPRSEVVSAACAGLLQLRSGRAVPALIQTLLHPREEARNAAAHTLRALTGRDLPADFEAWVGG